MGDIHAGQNTKLFLIGGITFFICVLIHFVYKIAFKSKKNEAPEHEVESDSGKFNCQKILEIRKLK